MTDAGLFEGDEVAAFFRDALVQALAREPRLAEQPALVAGRPVAQHRHCRAPVVQTSRSTRNKRAAA